ncbi:MAG: hypothetical protein R3E62_03595 [Pseudomonadales bacterium]
MMKKMASGLLVAVLAFPALVNADVVVSEQADTTLGKGVGGWAGVLLGGAAGGPLGALLVGATGVWAGGEVQEAAGQEGTSYLVRRDNGDEVVVRSPRQSWRQGDRVTIVGNRLVAAVSHDEVGETVAATRYE